MESCPEKWRYGVAKEDQPKLQPLLEGPERLRGRCLTAAVVVVAFHCRRVLPLMARWRCLFEMTPSDPIEGIKMSAFAISNDETLCRVREAVDGKVKLDDLMPFPMCPSRGYISLVSWVLPRPSRPSCSLSFLSIALFRRSCRG